MNSNSLVVVLCCAGCVGAAQAQVPVSLGNDFSLTNGNPNGRWSYKDSSGPFLSVQIPIQNGSPVYPALSNGYWGLGNDLYQNTPDLFKAQVDGASAGETNEDFLAGDILGHSPNGGSYLQEIWTAPTDGTISDLRFATWFAHSLANDRIDDFALLDNATVLTQGQLYSSITRSTAITYTNPGFSVVAGDTITLDLAKAQGQQFGSLVGQSLDFTFTPTPEPAGLAALSLGLLALARRRRA